MLMDSKKPDISKQNSFTTAVFHKASQPSVSSITFVLHTSHAIRACSLCPFTFLCQLLSTEVRISAGDGKPKCVDGFRLLDLIYQSKTAFCFCLQIIMVLAFWNLSETATDFLMHYTYRIVIGTRPEALLGSPNSFLSPGQTQVCLNRS